MIIILTLLGLVCGIVLIAKAAQRRDSRTVSLLLIVAVVTTIRLLNPHHHKWGPLRHMSNLLFFGLVLLVLLAFVLYRLFDRPTRPHGRRLARAVLVVTAALSLAAPFNWSVDWFAGKHSNKAAAPSDTTTTQPTNTTEIPQIQGYDLHYYSTDPGVPGGYFGPACVPNGDASKCRQDIEERVKHDPMLCTTALRNFNLLPGVKDGMSSDDIEAVRLNYSKQLEGDVSLRKDCAYKVKTVYDSMKDFHIEQLSGNYYTEYTDPNHNVTQTTKVMDPNVNVAVVGTTPDGVVHHDKVDCGHQTVSPTPIPGVPVKKPPSGTPPTTTVPSGKHDDGCAGDCSGVQGPSTGTPRGPNDQPVTTPPPTTPLPPSTSPPPTTAPGETPPPTTAPAPPVTDPPPSTTTPTGPCPSCV